MIDVSDRTSVDCCCCISGEVNVTVKLNKRVFVPGEPIVIYAEIHNSSNTEIGGSRVSLQQVSKHFLNSFGAIGDYSRPLVDRYCRPEST